MKRFFAIILSVILIAAVIYCVHSCTKDTDITEKEKTEGSSSDLDIYVPVDDPSTDEDESAPTRFEIKTEDDSPVYTGVGIYHGKVDSNFVEITFEEVHPVLRSARLAPDLAKDFSSLKLNEGDIISFEYQIISDMYIIQKIIK